MWLADRPSGRIITDAAYRRFKAQKIYLASRAALRAVNARQATLQGQSPNPRHAVALQQINTNFRTVNHFILFEILRSSGFD